MKIAALDIGSNTFLCLIAEVQNEKIVHIYEDQVEVVRLGQDLSKNKNFHSDALTRADLSLSRFKKTIEQHHPDHILAMATSAARDAENKEELFKIFKNYSIPVEIIPGEKEAEITFYGSTSGVELNKPSLVLDIGGGSTEFIVGEKKNISFAKSLNIGCVRLTEKFFQINELKNSNDNTYDPPQAVHVINAEQFITKQIASLPDFPIENILAVAGTPTTLAHVEIGGEFDPTKIDNYKFTLEKIEFWISKLTGLTSKEIIQLGFPAGRADVIFIGLLILKQTMIKFNLHHFLVSTRGVRFGVALEVYKRHHI